MSDTAALNDTNENFDNMTAAEFEERLPNLIATGQGSMTADPHFAVFFEKNPNCAALVRDLEAIAKAARDLFPAEEPFETAEEAASANDPIWHRINDQLKNEHTYMEGSSLDGPVGAVE